MKKLIKVLIILYTLFGVLVSCFESVTRRYEIDTVIEGYIQKFKRADFFTLKDLKWIKILSKVIYFIIQMVCWPLIVYYEIKNILS